MINIKALDFALAMFKNKEVEKPTGGMKFVNGDGINKGKYADIIESLTELRKDMESRDIMRVKKCRTCAAYQGAPNAYQGACFPTPFTNTRNCDGYCDRHEQKVKKRE